MFRVLFLRMGIALIVVSVLAVPIEAAEPDTVNRTAAQVEQGTSPARAEDLGGRASSGPRAATTVTRPSAGPTRIAADASLVDRDRIETLLPPSEAHKSVGNLPTSPEGRANYLEIEVSHSTHVFRLYAGSLSGKKEVLYECMVGLGSPSDFPTPVGVYFVTHIYDDNPWWIPSTKLERAAGKKPNRKVYGGTMVPMLKKIPAIAKERGPDSEDEIGERVKLDDHGYSFHGTNEPRSIGQNQSHGCVRMLPDDARKVANLIKEHVGVAERRESENGTYVILKSPVRLNLVK